MVVLWCFLLRRVHKCVVKSIVGVVFVVIGGVVVVLGGCCAVRGLW